MKSDNKMLIGFLGAIFFGAIFLFSDFRGFILDLICPPFKYSYESRETISTIILIAEIAIVVVCLWMWFYYANLSTKEDKLKEEEELKILEEKRAKAKAKYESDLADMEAQYGMIANKISVVENSLENSILVFHDIKKVWLCGNMYPYSNILSCTFSDNKRTIKGETELKTKTSTGSMLGRAVVGGVLTGGIGAAVGAATAGKKTVASNKEDTVIHDYTVIVNTNNISNPVIRIACGEDEVLTNNIVGLINAIISHKG
ncbi:MAG: hypothetical protein LUC37_06975 [Prevotella sp.]|nr:hypothetical protein [Prevotella sp.]